MFDLADKSYVTKQKICILKQDVLRYPCVKHPRSIRLYDLCFVIYHLIRSKVIRITPFTQLLQMRVCFTNAGINNNKI